MTLISKKIALGITGGIAAYKACELIRDLKKLGAEVRVAMTPSAQEFVTGLTLATLSENPVLTSLFEGNEKLGTVHIGLARWCDLFVICPATANILGKAAAGIADDAISTSILATEAKVIFCPAMNSVMWEKAAVQENIAKLREFGYDFVEPEWGALATTTEGEGWGRLASIATIVQKIKTILLETEELRGKKVLVTAGATRAPIDPVRFITNYATGKMGFALAESAQLKGAEVSLISGPNNLAPVSGVKYIAIDTVDQMQKAMAKEYDDTDILIMAAAVSDYQPKKVSDQKLKKSTKSLTLELEKTTDILATFGKNKSGRIHIGFALETENGPANALKKLNAKNLDLIVLNNPLEEGAAFAGDTNVVSLIGSDGQTQKFPKMSKTEVADLILQRVVNLLQARVKLVVAN